MRASSGAMVLVKQWSSSATGLVASRCHVLRTCIVLLRNTGGGGGGGGGLQREVCSQDQWRQCISLSGTASCSSGQNQGSGAAVSGRQAVLQSAGCSALGRRFVSRASAAATKTGAQAPGLGRRGAADGDAGKVACPGCGVDMQDKDPKAPGFFKRPAALEREDEQGEEMEAQKFFVEDQFQEEDGSDGEEEEEEVRVTGKLKWEGMNWEALEGWAEQDKGKEEMTMRMSDPTLGLDQEFGVGWNEVGGNRQGAKDAWKKLFGKQEVEDELGQGKVVVCARCHSLRNYAQVKDEEVENLLPDFDFDRLIGARLKKAYGRRAVVVMVIDSADFDGSFPRKAAALLAQVEQESGEAWKDGMPANTPRLVIVLNKIDLLPKQVSPKRLEQWVRRRSKAGGAPRVSGVHLVSAHKGWGIANLALQIKDLAGSRGDVWVIGAQNAGKSSLINAFGKLSGGKGAAQLTEAPVPGTTIGIVKLEGILPDKARLYDTPGLLHPHQLTTRLNREELKMVQMRKEMKPRTYRVKAGNTILLGGLLRMDVVQSSVDSFYVSVFASAYIPLHMGKSDSADELLEKHVGDRLTPPMDGDRLDELGPWVARTVTVKGDQWDVNSTDVAVAGLGWFSFGIKGTTVLKLWTFEGVAVTIRDAMVFDKAPQFEKPGFTVPIAAPKPDKLSKKGKAKSVMQKVSS